MTAAGQRFQTDDPTLSKTDQGSILYGENGVPVFISFGKRDPVLLQRIEIRDPSGERILQVKRSAHGPVGAVADTSEGQLVVSRVPVRFDTWDQKGAWMRYSDSATADFTFPQDLLPAEALQQRLFAEIFIERLPDGRQSPSRVRVGTYSTLDPNRYREMVFNVLLDLHPGSNPKGPFLSAPSWEAPPPSPITRSESSFDRLQRILRKFFSPTAFGLFPSTSQSRLFFAAA